MTRKKIIIPILVAGILITLLFIPANEFLIIDSQRGESPSPIMVLENSDTVLLGLQIIPVSCNETENGFTESHFQITNNNEKDYDVKVEISFTDNSGVLYEKQVNLEVLSGQTINQNFLSDKIYDNPVCVVKIVEWEEI
jgi:hypothetical protein